MQPLPARAIPTPLRRLRLSRALCRGAWRGYEYIVYYTLLLLFALSSLAWSLAAALLHRLLPRRIGAPLGQWMMMAGFRYFVGAMRLSGIIHCDLRALDVLRREPPLVIAPNHPSLLDAVLVISRLPRVVCVAKPEIWDNPCLGGGARLAGFIRNDSPRRVIAASARELGAGKHFLIFPEGTRSSAHPVGAFKGGFALIAKQAGVPVQTVFIECNSSFLGKGSSLLRKPDFPLIFRVRLGRRFGINGDVHDAVDAIHRYFRQELAGHRSGQA